MSRNRSKEGETMISLETVILIQLLVGILLLILLRKTITLKKQIVQVIREVTEYLNYISEEESRGIEEIERPIAGSKTTPSKRVKDEAQNRLIQSVLQEYFP